MRTVWKWISGYEGLYKVSNKGEVWSERRNSILHPDDTSGYLRVSLCKEGSVHKYMVHRLVATTFIPKPFGEYEVNHKDENKHNNCVDNLEWMTRKENANYGTAIERRVIKRRNNSKWSKPIMQMTMDGEVVKEFPSINEARRQGYDAKSVIGVCRGTRKQHKGYLWKYKGDNT